MAGMKESRGLNTAMKLTLPVASVACRLFKPKYYMMGVVRDGQCVMLGGAQHVAYSRLRCIRTYTRRPALTLQFY